MVRLLMVWLGVLRQGREGGTHSSVTGCTWIGSDGRQPSGKSSGGAGSAPAPDWNAPVCRGVGRGGRMVFHKLNLCKYECPLDDLVPETLHGHEELNPDRARLQFMSSPTHPAPIERGTVPIRVSAIGMRYPARVSRAPLLPHSVTPQGESHVRSLAHHPENSHPSRRL